MTCSCKSGSIFVIISVPNPCTLMIIQRANGKHPQISTIFSSASVPLHHSFVGCGFVLLALSLEFSFHGSRHTLFFSSPVPWRHSHTFNIPPCRSPADLTEGAGAGALLVLRAPGEMLIDSTDSRMLGLFWTPKGRLYGSWTFWRALTVSSPPSSLMDR